MTGTNRAAIVLGPEKGLEVIDIETNSPNSGEVLIKNQAIAIQPLDAKMLHAGYGGAETLQNYPFVLGTGGAGTVEEIGDGVTGVAVGDRVVFDTGALVRPLTNMREGTWQQYVISDADTVAKVGKHTRCPKRL